MCCTFSRVACLRALSAWTYYVHSKHEQEASKATYDADIARYSTHMRGKQQRAMNETLRRSCFVEWHRAAIMLIHRSHLSEARATVAHKERENADLQEQLRVYYQQIDSITKTLQKELRTKEELAMELRQAYESMRKTNSASSSALGQSPLHDMSHLSRTSSDQTLRVGSQSHIDSVGIGRCGAIGLEAKSSELFSVPSPPTARLTEPVAVARGRSPTRASDLPRSVNSSSTREVSPSCDWDHVVARLEGHGYLKLECDSAS